MTDRETYVGNFLESCDLIASSGPVTLTIENYVPENTERDSRKQVIDRPIVSFRETPKRLIVGKTNERLLRAQCGKPEQWAGKQIKLRVCYLKTFLNQRNVPCIRIAPESEDKWPMGCRSERVYGRPRPYTAEELK